MKKTDVRHSVRQFCLECQGNSATAVRECVDTACALWPHRLPGAVSPEAGSSEHAVNSQERSPEFACSAESCVPLFASELSETIAEHQAEQKVELGAEFAASPTPSSPKAREAQRRVLLRAVRRHCLSCAASRADVRACAAREECGLWSYRFGVRPETYRSVRERFLRPKNLSLFT